jgi:hypothetical protein
MPHRPVRTRRDLVARALPWAGLLAVSVSSAWAMNVGLTDGVPGPGRFPPQSPPLVGDAPPARPVGDLVGDDALTLRRFHGTSKVLTINVDGPGGPQKVYCDTTTDRTPFDAVSVRPEQVIGLFRQLCPPPPSAS